jgi:hypothetical protein
MHEITLVPMGSQVTPDVALQLVFLMPLASVGLRVKTANDVGNEPLLVYWMVVPGQPGLGVTVSKMSTEYEHVLCGKKKRTGHEQRYEEAVNNCTQGIPQVRRCRLRYTPQWWFQAGTRFQRRNYMPNLQCLTRRTQRVWRVVHYAWEKCHPRLRKTCWAGM